MYKVRIEYADGEIQEFSNESDSTTNDAWVYWELDNGDVLMVSAYHVKKIVEKYYE